MVSTFTANIQLEEPARGDQVGTWDTPVNNNMTLIDLALGGVTTINLNNSNVVLAAAQFQSKTIIFASTLTGSVVITFPTSFNKSYEILNQCTGSSAFTVTLKTTAAGASFVCAPPSGGFDATEIIQVGGNIVFKNLGRIGEYWDYAGSSVPGWVSGCNPPPYLNCVGGSFSSATYPQLTVILNGTTLPDSRVRARIALGQGSAIMSNFATNVVGNTFGDQNMQAHVHGITDPGHVHSYSQATFPGGGTIVPAGTGGPQLTTIGANTGSNATGITINSVGAGGSQNVQPSYIGGLTMIRAG